MSVPIRIENVSKAFPRAGGGRRVVLDDFTLHVEPGELVALVGPSGGGKTTILNVVAGLERADAGTVDLGPRPPVVGMVFQQPRLLDWVSARQNVALAAHAAGIDDARVDELLEAVGLSDHRHAFPTTLSGGQRQRLAVARAFVIDPQLVLLDEPFSALDELTARRLRLLLQELWLDGQRTGLLVSHNPLEAALLADRVVVLGTEPATILAEHAVTLPRPRHPEDEELYHLHRTIVSALV